MAFNKDRIAVAIGTGGRTKEKIEELTGTIIVIDSETGDYQIKPNLKAKSSDPHIELDEPGIRVYTTKRILQAINYGFNPKKSMELIKSEKLIEIIDLENVLGHSTKKLKRYKGRIIGESGKIRNSLEHFSGAYISVYKRYVSIIGDFSEIKIAKAALNMLLDGSPHKTVLNYLQSEYQKKKQEEFTKMWKPTL